jgi:MoxR-like ATPase
MNHSIDTIAANAAADAITYPITSENRNAVRKYLTAVGIPYAVAGMLTIKQLASVADIASSWPSDPEAHFRAASYVRSQSEQEPAATQPALPVTQPEPQQNPRALIPGGGFPAVKAGTPDPEAAARLADAVRDLIAGAAPQPAALDESRVLELIAEHAPKAEPRTLEIKISDRPAVTIDRQHYKFPLLLATIAARVPAYLVGPAGTGKTSAAHQTARALGLPFHAISVGPMTSKSDLFGMRDAGGNYHESDLVKAATRGGVFLFDEFDAGNPATLTAVNMLLANGSFSTPDGMREKSPDFVPVFALNTYGTGASNEYVGRNQLDAATLDRGAFISWPLDESLEASLIGIDAPAPDFRLDEGGVMKPETWLDHVRRYRAGVAAAKVRHIISPRATLYGVAMAAAGVGCVHLRDVLLVKGLDEATRAKISA